MAANAGSPQFDIFRGEWVHGHLDYQRADEAFEVARRRAARMRATTDGSAETEEIRRAEQHVEDARQRLAELKVILTKQFDRFCGIHE